jgi:putative sterol carrier protein
MSLESATQKVSENVANAASGLGATVKFAFGEGVIFIDGTTTPGTVSNEDQDAACTVSMELSDFHDMLNGDLNPMSAFMGGKMRIDGDMSVAMKLQSVLS